MVKAIKVMLIPNNVQKTKLFQYAGASRFAYNWALAKEISKAVQEQGFFGFRKQLEYKCNDKGILLIVADRFYPSSKLCSCCGNIKKDLKLSDRVYRCECGNRIDRDFQASINLKAYGEKFAS